jgi:polysaccharide pyruvyl transferase WcaK-like protein
MNLIDAVTWRYQLYVRPHLLIHENIVSAIIRKYNNKLYRKTTSPMCYISADATNVGDRASALGIQFLTGLPGVELFASKAALAGTFKALDWLEKNKPNTKIIVGGGGLLQECFVPFWSRLLNTNLQFSLFGVGANEMQGRRLPPDELLKTIAIRAVAVHVRDTWTQELMQYDKQRQILVGLCPSVNYLESRYKIDLQNTKKYLLHVQHPVDIRMAGGDSQRITEVVKCLAKQLNLYYDETNHVREDLDKLAKRYLRARYVITSRLHGCIFCHALNIPFVPIVTDKKTSAFIETHLSENPIADIEISKDELYHKLMLLRKMDEISSMDKLNKALKSNVSAMMTIIKKYDK